MKQGIHPSYFTDTRVTCSCGNVFTTSSLKKEIRVEVCSKCHPYFTGQHRFIDTKGRVENFQKKQQVAEVYRQTAGTKKTKKKRDQDDNQPKTLAQLLAEI